MKKRILSIIITVLLILTCFTFGVSASDSFQTYENIGEQNYPIIISDNYQTLSYSDNTYIRFDASAVDWDFYNNFSDTKCNLSEVKYVDYQTNETGTIVRAWIYFKDGGSFNATYIDKTYYDEYLMVLNNPKEYTINFSFPIDNNVSTTKNQFLGKKTTLTTYELWIDNYFDVNSYSQNGDFYVTKGSLILVDDKYYYVDFIENNVDDPINFFPDDYEVLKAYEITNKELIENLDAAYDEYNSDAVGFLTGEFSENISVVLLCIALVIVPLSALIIFLILSLRAKSPIYKKLFRTIYIMSAAELVVLAVIVALFIIF